MEIRYIGIRYTEFLAGVRHIGVRCNEVLAGIRYIKALVGIHYMEVFNKNSLYRDSGGNSLYGGALYGGSLYWGCTVVQLYNSVVEAGTAMSRQYHWLSRK